MADDAFDKYLAEINKAYLRGDATEHTHRPALKALIEGLDKKVTAVNEPRRIKCGAPDYIVSRRIRSLDQTIGYIEAKDIGTNLNEAAKSEQIKKRYLPSLHNFILTDYVEFRWYVNEEIRLTAKLAQEGAGGRFRVTEEGRKDVAELLGLFLSQEPEKVSSAKELAVRMAGLARLLRDITEKTFKQEEEKGTLHSQFEAFREVLIHDLTEEQFAGMYAQTIAYGLFTARCYIDDITVFGQDRYAAFHGIDERAREFTRKDAAYLLPKTNPFLRKVFGHIAGPDLDDRIAWLVDDLATLLRESRMDVILRDFTRGKKRKDPVVHFYETFLAEYDPKLRKKRGVYYTPDEVVSYIVRSVEWLLKEKFGLKRGLADESKIKVNGQESHKVLILDPAVGTGTFLFEVIEQIQKKFKGQKGMWSGYVREHLLPRLFGFEIQMAPYAVAHMKIGLQLAETGYDFASDERLGIYLTNTLEEAGEISKTLFAQWLSEEARAANNVKKELPIMVVLGNPPYANFGMMNKSKWILGLLEDYKKGLNERKINIDDDFIKFIRFGQHRIEQTGSGILAFITNHTFIDGITHRRMRESLMESFSEIYILDLHGNSKKKEICPDGSKDENIFDIQQGVSIGIFIKEQRKEELAKVYHADLYGLRKNKSEWLAENDIKSTGWENLTPKSSEFFFVPKDLNIETQYDSYYLLTDIFKRYITGVDTKIDRLLTDRKPEELEKRMKTILDPQKSIQEIKTIFDIPNSSTWEINRAKTAIFNKDKIRLMLYRPFDKLYTYFDNKVLSRARESVMQNFIDRSNIGLCFMRQYAYPCEYCYFLVTNNIVESRIFISNRGRSCITPLYLYPTEKTQSDFDLENWPRGKDGRIPNLDKEFVSELAKKIGLKFVSDGAGDLKKDFGPEDVLGYIYGIFHSPEYRKRYAEFLKIDFPRVPMPPDKDMFVEICKIGQELIKLHLLESDILEGEKRWPLFGVAGNNIVEKGYPKYVAKAEETEKGRVYINKDQFFEGVRPEVWEFHIGGYQVCEKWLKDRRGRELSYEDKKHYQKIVVALGETMRLMKEPCLSEMFEKKA